MGVGGIVAIFINLTNFPGFLCKKSRKRQHLCLSVKSVATHATCSLDILSDRFVESGVLIGLFTRQPELGLIILLMMMSMLICVSTFLLVGIFVENNGQKGFYYSDGLMERCEAFILFFIMIIWPQSCFIVGSLFVVLVLWTAFYRIYQFNKYCNKKAPH